MKIRNIAAKTAAVLGCSALLALVPAIAGDEAVAGEDLGAEVSVGYDTDYIFRGANLGQDLLWSDVNVSTSLSDGLGLNVGAWYANPTDGGGGDELDIYAGVSTDLGGMSLDIGSTYYYFPGATGDNELEVGAALGTTMGSFDVSAGVYHNTDSDNTYVELGVGTSFDLTDGVSLDIGASIGNNQDAVGGQADGLSALTVTIGAPIGLSDNATITPYVGLNAPLDDNEGTDDEIFSGISLTVGF